MCLRKVRIHKTTGLARKHHLYLKGKENLERELDVVTIIRSIRQLRLVAQVLLSPSERMLLKFQKDNIVDTTS